MLSVLASKFWSIFKAQIFGNAVWSLDSFISYSDKAVGSLPFITSPKRPDMIDFLKGSIKELILKRTSVPATTTTKIIMTP